MPTRRFEPPTQASDDPQSCFEQLSQVLDQQNIVAQYKPVLDAQVTVAAGEFRRLAPRAAGQNVTIPTADGSTFGQTITLLLENSLGVCRIRPVSGTINGHTAITYGIGSRRLQLTSNGVGQWLCDAVDGQIAEDIRYQVGVTEAGAGPFAPYSLAANVDTLIFSSASAIVVSGLSAPSVNPEGRELLILAGSAVTSLTLVHAAFPGNAIQFSCPNAVNFVMGPRDSVYVRRFSGSWRVISKASSGGGALADGDYGDVVVSGGGTIMTVDDPVFARVRALAWFGV